MARKPPPNILLVMFDQMAALSLPCYGHPLVRAPHLGALAMGGVVFGLVVGYLLDHGYGYGAVFAIVSTLHVLGFLLILATIRRIEPLRFERTS